MSWTLKRHPRRVSRISVALTIAVAFARAACGPPGGWSVVEFWLLLFYAAAMNGYSEKGATGLDARDVELPVPLGEQPGDACDGHQDVAVCGHGGR